MKKLFTLKALRLLSIEVLWIGACISIAFMYKAGRNNDSLPLKLLFLFWVASPFITLSAVYFISKTWSVLSIKALCILMLVIGLGLLAIYSGILIPPRSKPAFIFLIVPLVSCMLLAAVKPIIYRNRED